MDLAQVLAGAVSRGASDIHLRPGRPPALRIDGHLVDAGPEPLSADEVREVALTILPAPRAEQFSTTNEADFAYEVDGLGRYRVNAFRQQGEIALVLRQVRIETRDLEQLGLPAVIRRLADEPRGLVLVTGRVGSGKTTTLAAMVDRINETRDGHILTIEDPVEIRHVEKRCVISQRDVGLDTEGFRTALKHAFRQDPDVILVGEMRDPDTVWSALSAAETGHLVLSTLHTVNATETVNRIIDFFPPEQSLQVRASLAATLRGVVSQRLLPRASAAGRVPAVEVLVGTGRVFDRILDPERTHELETVISEGGFYGMQTFEQSLLGLYSSGAITREVAISAATRPHDLMLKIEQLPASADREAGGTPMVQTPTRISS
jgi:twitching motility protein PilT